uniref:hypothetical protein n=1 Tax=Lactococcus garvieae TaxID=1363 RepID=UPI00359C2A70
WYDDHVKGTAFERYVQPVVLPNPTLGDMIDLGVLKSNTESNVEADWWQSHDAKYRTRVDESHGIKQAFALSSADVSSGKRDETYPWTTFLSPEAIAWRDKINQITWLRSPGAHWDRVANVKLSNNDIDGNNENTVVESHAVIPSLVVHVP